VQSLQAANLDCLVSVKLPVHPYTVLFVQFFCIFSRGCTHTLVPRSSMYWATHCKLQSLTHHTSTTPLSTLPLYLVPTSCFSGIALGKIQTFLRGGVQLLQRCKNGREDNNFIYLQLQLPEESTDTVHALCFSRRPTMRCKQQYIHCAYIYIDRGLLPRHSVSSLVSCHSQAILSHLLAAM